MATASFGSAVTSALELLAGYAYTTPADPVRTDPAYAQLQPLGEAAQALIQERNDLRDQLQAALDELQQERLSSQAHSASLQELIRRVRSLPEEVSRDLLEDIEMPAEGSAGLVLPHLLEEATLRRGPLQATRVDLDTQVELPTVNAYLDRALEKARQSIDLYAQLELAPEPSIHKTWEDLVNGLNTSLSAGQPLIQTVTAKAQALMVLKSIETVSLEAAVRGFQRMRNKLEDVVAESESWVVEELYHARLPQDCDVQAKIQSRVGLAQQPFTVEGMEQLMRIFEEYEYLRKTAALKPWEERVQPEMEWWRLVTMGQQLFSHSETVLRTAGGDSADLREEVERLQRDSPTSTEGVFHFLHGLLDVLIQAERLKDGYLRAQANDVPSNILHDLCRDVLNLSMVFAAFANEPLTELLRLNSSLNRPDSDPKLLARELHHALQRLLQVATARLTDKVSFKWLRSVLEQCKWRGSEDLQKRVSAALGQLAEKEADTFEEYVARRSEMERCVQLALAQRQAAWETQEEQWRQVGTAVSEACYAANSAASELQEVPVLQEAGVALRSHFAAPGSPCETIESLGTALQELASSYAAYESKASQEKAEILTNLLSDLQKQMDSVFPSAISLAEYAEKEELAAQCRDTLQRDMAPQTLFSTQLHLISSVLGEAKTVLRSRTAAMDTTTLVRKGKHILDTVVRNAEDLAKGTVDPANEKRTREALQKVTVSVGHMGLAEVLDAVLEALKVERQQVDARVHEEFAVADVCEVSLAPVSPAKRLSAVPSADQKLSTGFTHLRQHTKTLIELLEIVIEKEEYARKEASLEHYAGLDRLLQEQGLLLWLLQQAAQSYHQPLEPILAASLETLEAAAALIEDEGDRQDVQAAVYGAREEGKQPTRPLRQLVLEVEELTQARLHLLQREPAQAGVPSVLKGIERLMSVYDAELLTHGIKITITQQDLSVLQGCDEQQMALTRLTIMERALRALAEKAAVQKQEVRENRDYITRSSRTIYATVLEVLEIVSVEDADEVKRGESQLDDQLKKIETAAVRLKSIMSSLCTQQEATHRPSTDFRSQLAVSQETFAPLPPQRTKLMGFPPKATPYTQLDKATTEAGTSLLRLLDLQGQRDLRAAGTERLSVSAGSGDALAIIGDKLSLIKDIGSYLSGNYRKNVGLALVPLFESAKRNLNTARGLLKSGAKKEEVWTVVSQLASRVSANKEEVQDCLGTAEATMQRVLAELVQDIGASFEATDGEVSEAAEEVRQKLSALPSSTDKVSTGMEFLMRQTGHLLSSLCLVPAPETIAQLEQVSKQTGQDKLLLQQAVLHSELKAIQEALTAAFKPLTEQFLRNIRLVARHQGNSAEVEPALVDIEAAISGNGVNLSLLGDTAAILDVQLQDLKDTEDFAATSAEVHAQAGPPLLRSRLMALPTAAERLSKGMDFLLREADSLASTLCLPGDRDRPAQTQKISEATGQDQLLLQQALIHSLLKRTSVQLNSYLKESTRILQATIRTTSNMKGCARKIDPELAKIEQTVQMEGVQSRQVLRLLELLDRVTLEPSVGVQFEETAVEVQSTPVQDLRSRLAAGNTGGDRLEKGLDFVIQKEVDLLELLGLLQEEYSRSLEACKAATGQERLLQQQDLLYRGLKAAYTSLQSNLNTGLDQAFAVSDHLAGFLTGSPKTAFQEAIQSIRQEKGAYGGRLNQLSAVLGQLAGLHLPPPVSGVRPPKTGPSAWETMNQLLSQLGSYLGRPPVSDSKDLQSTCPAELSGCLMDLKAVVDTTLQGLIAHSKYLDTFVPAGEAKQRSIAAVHDLEVTLHSPTAPKLPLLPTAVQCLHTQQVLISPFSATEDYTEAPTTYATEEIEGPGTKLASRPHHNRKKLSSVPTSGDRLDKGMVYILKELGSLVDILPAPPGEDAAYLTKQAEEAEGQDKVLLRQGIVHSELKRLVVVLQTAVSSLYGRLLTFLPSFQLNVEQASTLSYLQGVSCPRFSDLEVAEALVETLAVQMGTYVEAAAHEEVEVRREPERTRLSAVPNSGDKVGKGMNLLLQLTGKIYHKTIGEPAAYMEVDLMRISSTTGQDKVLLQQALLHRELKDVLQAAEAPPEYEEVVEVVEQEVVEESRQQLQSVPVDTSVFEEVLRASFETAAAFQVFVTAETQAEMENLRSALPGSKPAIQRRIILQNLASLKTQAEVLRTEELDHSTASALVTRVKVALEPLLGEFTAEWRTAVSLCEKLRVVANHVDKTGTQLTRQAQVLVPYLQQFPSSEVSTRLSAGDILGAAESGLNICLTDAQEIVLRLAPYITTSSEMLLSDVIETLVSELEALCEAAEVSEPSGKLAAARNHVLLLQRRVNELLAILTEIESKETKTTIVKKTTVVKKKGDASPKQ